MQISIFRTGTIALLTVICSCSVSAQQYRDSGDRYFNFNIYRDSDDSTGLTTIVCQGSRVYVLQMQDGRVVNFSVDGRHIAADSLGRYQSVIDDIKVQMKEDEEQAKRNRVQAELNRQQAQRNREQAQRNREQAERDREQAERDREQADQNRQQAERNRQQADRNREQAERNRQQAERNREQADRNREQAEEDRKLMDSLITDLIADGVIRNRDGIHSIKMDPTQIIVNGNRLPEALEKKYLDKYARKGLSISSEWD